MAANSASAFSDQELKLLVRIFDAHDYEQRRGRYDNPIAAKRAIVEEVIHTIRDSIGVVCTVGQIKRKWSFLRYTVPDHLQRLRGEIRQEQRHLRCRAQPASPAIFGPLAHPEAPHQAEEHEQQALLPVRELEEQEAPDLGIQSHSPVLVWILGHSYVVRGAIRAAAHRDGQQLGFPCQDVTVRWIGRGGMHWPQFMLEFDHFVALDRCPDILLVHAGGNDIGALPSQQLVALIQTDLLRLWTLYPHIITVWSDIVPRQVWREARSVSRLNRARIKVNRAVGNFMRANGALALRHPDLESGQGPYWRHDGIHLNDAGMDIWCFSLKSGIETALSVLRDATR